MLAELVDHVIGVDPDRDWITVAALDSRTAGVISTDRFPATRDGYRDAIAWADAHTEESERAWVIEGTASYGRGLTMALATSRRTRHRVRPADAQSNQGRRQVRRSRRHPRGSRSAGSRQAQPAPHQRRNPRSHPGSHTPAAATAKPRTPDSAAPHPSRSPPARTKTATGSIVEAIASSTGRSTSLPSPANAAARKPRTTWPGEPAKARPNEKPHDASNGSSHAASGGSSSTPNYTLTRHRSIGSPRRRRRNKRAVWLPPTPVPGVHLRVAFVSVLVVAGEPRHEFLLVAITGIGHELVGSATSQRCGDATMMRDDYVAVLAPRPFEILWLSHSDSLLDRFLWCLTSPIVRRTRMMPDGTVSAIQGGQGATSTSSGVRVRKVPFLSSLSRTSRLVLCAARY